MTKRNRIKKLETHVKVLHEAIIALDKTLKTGNKEIDITDYLNSYLSPKVPGSKRFR